MPGSLRRRAALLALSLTTLAGTAGASVAATGGVPSNVFVGSDGLSYVDAPVAVDGADGQLYFGTDFDVACSMGAAYGKRLDRMSKVADVIRASGRQVLFAVAPDNTEVDTADLVPSQFPHGYCDSAGLAAQQNELDTLSDPSYVPLRKALAKDKGQMYWKTDPHWTSLGGAVFSQAVASRLDPRLAHLQKFKPTTMTAVGELNGLRGIEDEETVPSVQSVTPVTITTAPGSADWLGYPQLIFDYSWDTHPASKAWPGRTVLVGDSFMWFALDTLRPLFAHGRYLWTGNVPTQTLIDGIVHSDTVVIEAAQFLVPRVVWSSGQFRHDLAKALGHQH